MSAIIETTAAELQMQFVANGTLRELPRPQWITDNAVSPEIEVMLREARPARRPPKTKPDNQPSDAAAALVIRQKWMELMGLSKEEIAEGCQDGPYSLSEERAELEAMERIAKRNQ